MIHTLETKIEKVTVYQIGARITRKGVLHLEPGDQTVRVTEMTQFLDKESVRVKGTGHGQITNVSITKQVTKKENSVERETLMNELKDLKIQKKHLEQDSARILDEKNRYEEFSSTFYKRIPIFYGRHGLELQKIQEMETHLKQQEDQIIHKQRDLESNYTEILDKITILEKKLHLLGNLKKIKEFNEISVNLSVSQACDFTFIIEFQHSRASWHPFYDINLTDVHANVKLLANVKNISLEDWNDVLLEISSASMQPVKIIKPIPFIVRERIIRTQNYQKNKRSAPRMLKEQLYHKPAMIESAGELAVDIREELPAPSPPPKMTTQTATMDQNLGVQSYHLPTRLTIPSNLNPHPVTLLETTLDSEKGFFWSVASPNQVIIQDKIINDETLLLPGKAKVYFEGEYIGESQIPLIAPHESVKLGMRRSYDLKIEKTLLHRKRAKEGILKGKVAKHYEYEIKIQNLKESNDPVTIMDRIIHSDSEKIKVIPPKFSINPDENQMGVLKWELALKGKKELIITYEYDVQWEKDVRITPPLP